MKTKTVILLAIMAVISAVAVKKVGDNSVAYAPTISEEEMYSVQIEDGSIMECLKTE